MRTLGAVAFFMTAHPLSRDESRGPVGREAGGLLLQDLQDSLCYQSRKLVSLVYVFVYVLFILFHVPQGF